MKHGKIAAYSILKNEKENIDCWLKHTSAFDYRVLVDTGSTDGSWEYLKEKAEKDKNLLIFQCLFEPFHFDTARTYCLSFVPKDTEWCISIDLDEYFSINVIDEIEKIIDYNPDVTLISCDRLDINSKDVKKLTTKRSPIGKIHKRYDYFWYGYVNEKLVWNKPNYKHKEIYAEDLPIIHTKNFEDDRISLLRFELMIKKWKEDPKNVHNNWFLLEHYYKDKNLEMYLPVACNYIQYNMNINEQFLFVYNDVMNIYRHYNLSDQQKFIVELSLKQATMNWARSYE